MSSPEKLNEPALSVSAMDFAAIVGASRSGTTWLQALLAGGPGVVTHTELKLFSHYVEPLYHSWSFDVHDPMPHGLASIWTVDDFETFVARFLTDALERVTSKKPQAEILLDKMPQYLGRYEHIERFMPGTRYIHVIRDGRDVASSLVAAHDDGWGREWAPGTVRDAARWWKRGVRAGRRANVFGPRYLEIRYEALKGDPFGTLSSVLDFLQLEWSTGEKEQAVAEAQIERMRAKSYRNGAETPQGFVRNGKTGGWDSSMSTSERLQFDRVAGDLLASLGYAQPGWWGASIGQRAAVRARTIVAAQGLRTKAYLTKCWLKGTLGSSPGRVATG